MPAATGLVALLFCLSLLASRCEAGGRDDAPTLPQGWRRVEVGAVSLAVPGNLRAEPQGGKDSMARTFRRPGLRLVVDYGWYSDPLEDRPGIEFTRSATEVDGRPATSVRYRSPDPGQPSMAGIHVPDVGDGTLKLTVLAYAESEADLADAERILRSVRIDLDVGDVQAFRPDRA
jgi:hypothetical protein